MKYRTGKSEATPAACSRMRGGEFHAAHSSSGYRTCRSFATKRNARDERSGEAQRDERGTELVVLGRT